MVVHVGLRDNKQNRSVETGNFLGWLMSLRKRVELIGMDLHLQPVGHDH